MHGEARLIPVAVPAEVAAIATYAPHVTEALAFGPQERRKVPEAIRERILRSGPAGEASLAALDMLASFMDATFVFDDLKHSAREVIRTGLERNDPAGHAWYEGHMMRNSKISAVIASMESLKPYVGRFFRQIMDEDLDDAIPNLANDAAHRWKTIISGMADLQPHEQGLLQRQFIENRLGPKVLDVFDAAMLRMNEGQEIGTLPDGRVSDNMRELLDIRAFKTQQGGMRRAAPDQEQE
jgi:hypothetical protein